MITIKQKQNYVWRKLVQAIKKEKALRSLKLTKSGEQNETGEKKLGMLD